ncbi:histone-lysine N-methyltransferase eggless-like [Oratosquilla oratoria]|uniref:histone-lysine N-methyltransferase eggless-like n=1 Tax=Oratosquilla oratoria TaxID=337810 RepID=UPI003F75D139
MAEVINLSDDDDDDIIIEDDKNKLPEVPPKIFKCLNPECRTERDLMKASEVVRRYYGVLLYPRKIYVCSRCTRAANRQQDSFIEAIRLGRTLLAEKLLPQKDTVVLTDSDSDPSDDSSESDISQYEVEISSSDSETSCFGDYIKKVVKNLGLQDQVADGIKHIEARLNVYQDKFEKLDKEYKGIEDSLDKVRMDFYSHFNPEYQLLPTVEIGSPDMLMGFKIDPLSYQRHQFAYTERHGTTSKRKWMPEDSYDRYPTQENTVDAQHRKNFRPWHSDIIAESPVYNFATNLPPVGPLVRPELSPNTLVYSMKYSLFARWVQAHIIEVEKREAKNIHYKIRYQKHSKGGGLPRIMAGKFLAYHHVCLTRIPVGTRVIAKYKDEDSKNVISGSFYVGIVAEVPTAANKFRYLVFFDDGYAQYVFHQDIRVVAESSECTWEDVAQDSSEFIREYLQMYPERPMVRLQKHNYIKTERNGRWWNAQVKEVDGSLVKMFFAAQNRSEWIYRGSTRLSPLFNKKLSLQARQEQQNKAIIRRRTAFPSKNQAVVEYGTFGQDSAANLIGQEQGTEARLERRSYTRKASSISSPVLPRDVITLLEQERKGIVRILEVTTTIPQYAPHECSSKCVELLGGDMVMHKGKSPLLFPMFFGWRRQILKSRHAKRGNCKTSVGYVGPCGRRMRNIEDVFHFLRLTSTKLEIDCFTFERDIRIANYWEPSKRIIWVEDISKCQESIGVSCVNSLDENQPLHMEYSNIRIPTSGVPLNTDPGFLICCDCEDDCWDKSKCACWQLTIESTRIKNGVNNPDVGYQHRRLYEQVQTGLYECNSRCTCKSTCLNRVVQHPLRLKLQLFRTARRGWGVRTLHDIPKGTFIAVYVGRILSETKANQEGKSTGGDDYYAELDFIEVMEDYKEGYEDTVEEIEEPCNDDGTKAAEEVDREESDICDSDGFFSENEEDNTEVDKDFHAAQLAKKQFEKRERSARIRAKEERKNSQRGVDSKRNVEKETAESKEEKEEEDKDVSKNEVKDVKDKETEKEKPEEKEKSESEKGSENTENHPENNEEESSDEEDEIQRKPQNFAASQSAIESSTASARGRRKSVRDYYSEGDAVYIIDAKSTGNIGRYLNHSCQPNVFVQNVFVDTHDLRFPWVAFFASTNIRAGCELTWDYNYEVDSVPGKVKYCYCGAKKCRGRLL